MSCFVFGMWLLRQLQTNPPVFHQEAGAHRGRSLLQRPVQDVSHIRVVSNASHESLPLLFTDRQGNLESPPAAGHRAAIVQRDVHGLDEGVCENSGNGESAASLATCLKSSACATGS